MNFPVISPLSYFPIISLLSPKGYLHSMLSNIQVRQETKDECNKVEKELAISHKSHQMWIEIDHFINQLISYTYEGDMLAFISIYQTYKLLHCILVVCFELDVHGYLREFDKNFF